jgi:hypothetical protein
MPAIAASPDADRPMRWYEHFTESPAFKRIVDPAKPGGRLIVTLIALGFAIVAFVQNPNTTRNCASNPLARVYNPSRLRVLRTCAVITVTVRSISPERDGDLHIGAAARKQWLSPANIAHQHGLLVVEYMPSDPWPRPHIGDRLRLTGTWVSDLQHGGWYELHPVFAVQPLGVADRRLIP